MERRTKDTPPKLLTIEPRNKSDTLTIQGHEVAIETGQGVMPMINISERVNDHYEGPSYFAAVVEFGSTFIEEGMRGEVIPVGERWSAGNPPPDGIKILEFTVPSVQFVVSEISKIARTDFYNTPSLRTRYQDLNQIVFNMLASNDSDAIKKALLSEDSRFLALIRGGLAAGMMLGIPIEDQHLVQTKRLPLKDQEDGEIAIGITPYNPEKIHELNGKHVIIADPAGATFGSIVGNLAFLRNEGIVPAKVTILNTVASHKGSLFALNAIREMGIDVQIMAAGYSPAMNSDYYLETPEDENGVRWPSVRDAGNGLNHMLPSQYQH